MSKVFLNVRAIVVCMMMFGFLLCADPGSVLAADLESSDLTDHSSEMILNIKETEATVTVSASNSARLTPDRVSISFSVTNREKTAELAQKTNNRVIGKIIDALTGSGVDKKSISTTNYILSAQYDLNNSGEQSIVGYNACSTIMIRDQDINNTGRLLSSCVEAGANNIDQVIFFCSDYEQAYQKALAQAVEKAREKAGSLSGAVGKTLGDIVMITEGSKDHDAGNKEAVNIAFSLDDGIAADADTPALLPGDFDIMANVRVTFQMK